MKQYNFKINGNEYNVTINSVDGNVADVTVVASYKVELGNGMAPISVNAAPAQQAAQAPVQARQHLAQERLSLPLFQATS